MKRWEEQVQIAAKPADVFAYFSDFTRHGEWSGHGLQVTKTSDGPIAPGSTFATEAKQFGTQREQSTITEVSPPTRFVWESVGGQPDSALTCMFAPQAGTRARDGEAHPFEDPATGGVART